MNRFKHRKKCEHIYIDITMVKDLGEEPYPQIPPNREWLSPKFKKSEIENFRKQNEFSPK